MIRSANQLPNDKPKGAIVCSDSRRAPCSPLLASEFSILFHQLLQRVGQLLEGNDLDFRAITEMRKNIENNMLARVRHYADDQADLFVDNRLYHLRNVRGSRGADRLQPAEIRQDAKSWRDVLQRLVNLFHRFPDILFVHVPGQTDHEQALGSVCLDWKH